MILIAESGSSKTTWCLTDTENVQFYQTSGINPYYQTSNQIASTLKQELLPWLPATPRSVYFYGAGCTPGEKTFLIRELLAAIFPFSDIEVYDDLIAAARSLCGKCCGITCILGTGTNTGFYNGYSIEFRVPGLGYMLGDEGSGAVFGKKLIQAYLRNDLPRLLADELTNKYQLTTKDILDSVYHKAYPNRFLGSFSGFIYEKKNHPFMQQMIREHFEEFYQNILAKYSAFKNEELYFTGSVAYHFREYIQSIGENLYYKINTIVRDPIEGLIKYHLTSKNEHD